MVYTGRLENEWDRVGGSRMSDWERGGLSKLFTRESSRSAVREIDCLQF